MHGSKQASKPKAGAGRVNNPAIWQAVNWKATTQASNSLSKQLSNRLGSRQSGK
jgi:hypothetical protein